jgi:hypothetical protein
VTEQLATKKPWAILVWIAGDNNLSRFGTVDLGELKQVGSNVKVHLVAQYDRAGHKGTQRYMLRKGTTLESDAVAELGETNTGDPKVAIDFFTWGIKNYPSDHVMCVLWNHGSGIDESDIYARARALDPDSNGKRARSQEQKLSRQHVRAIANSKLKSALFSTTITQALHSKAIALDDTSRDFLDNAELAHVLRTVVKNTGRKIDVLGFDACLMNMVEIAYQLRGLATYIVGSEEVEPGDGWPYEKVAHAATKPSSSTPAKVASAIVSSYIRSYENNPSAETVTQSAVDVSKVDDLAMAIDSLASICIANLQAAVDYMAFSQSVTNALRFSTRDFVDIGDLCKQLATRSKNSEVVLAAKAVTQALEQFVIAKGYAGAELAKATGTSIYFPLVGDAHVAYDQLDFAKETRWPELIAKYRGNP